MYILPVNVKGIAKPCLCHSFSSARFTKCLLLMQDDKIRKRNNWMNFLPTSGQVSPQSGSVSPANSSQNLLASSIQQITLDEAAAPSGQHNITSKAEPVSEDGPENCSTESQLANGELTHNTHSS